MIHRSNPGRAAVAAAVLLGSGCFGYAPVETGAVEPGEEVRVYVTRQGMAELEQVDLQQNPLIRGRVAEITADRLLLRVPVTRVREGFHSVSLGQDVPIPTAAITQMERRELNRGGTALLVGGTATIAAIVINLILDEGRLEERPSPPDPPETRIPFLSLPVP